MTCSMENLLLKINVKVNVQPTTGHEGPEVG